MRFTRTIALAGVGLLWLGFGPLVLLLAGLSLCFRQVRDWLRPTRRVVLAWVGAVLALAAVAYAVPDGWVRLPPGPGHLVTPGYVGRPATAQPVKALLLESPHLAPGGSRWPGPMGDSPHVWTKSYGVDGCRRIAVDSHGRLVSLCGSADAPVLRLVDPDNLRQLASKDLPERDDSPCFGAFYVDDHDRAVVATNDRRILLVSTADAEGDPDLTTQASVGIEGDIPDEDCVVGLQPDWQGRTWFVSAGGRVGVVDDGKARVADLAEQVDRPLTVTRDGVYVVSDEAVYRIGAAAGTKPTVAWRTPYDGTSGSAPVALSSGLVAVAVNGDSGLQVVLHRPGDGEEVCHTAVFGDDDGSTDGGLVAAGDAVVVQNGSGYGGPLATVLGRTTDRGLARVDADCEVAWSADLDVPSSPPAVSLASGLVFTYLKRHSWLGVDAWYLGAVDLRTGRLVYGVRTGLTVFADSHQGGVALGPDGSAYVPVLGGLVRVRDAHAD
jgi:hypothetical protein